MLAGNQRFVERMAQEDPSFFERMDKGQAPHTLWIGCSDSRVSTDVITDTDPGSLFVHRNIANMVVHTDLNLLSVLEYAVVYLKVNHIIVCGHYGCGGVKAAMGNHSLGIINKWLRNIKDVYHKHKDEVNSLTTEEEKSNRLIELNVREQVMNLAKTSIVQKAWKEEKRPHLHGWVYGLNNGIIKPVCEMEAGTHIDPLYEFDNL